MFTATTINQRKLGCWALLALSGDQRISTISYAVLTQYLIVTDGRHTDGRTDSDRHFSTAITALVHISGR